MRRTLVACLLVGASCSPAHVARESALITHISLYDGTGAPAHSSAVRIRGDTIVAVGDLQPESRDSVVDGQGLVLAPGFIDTHSHGDWGWSKYPDALAAVSQGITTIVVGQDGGQPSLPLASYFDSVAAHPVSVNVASYAGHNAIRSRVLGKAFRRKATPRDVDSMVAILRRELGSGALGVSTGLEYDPGIYSDPSEVRALAKVAADSGGRYISHIRSEDRWFWKAIDEIITIGREAKLPVQISHAKLAMTSLWGQGDSLIRVLDRARASGVDITADIYPYPFWQSTLQVLFPKRDFRDLAEARKVVREIAPADGIILAQFDADTTLTGKTLAEIAGLRKAEPAATLLALIQESLQWARAHGGDSGESIIATSMDEGDMATIMRWPHTNFCTDGDLWGTHPRGFGSYPRILGRYVRERKVMPLEEAIAKASSLAALHMGIRRRGRIQPGYFADLVLFDPTTVIDRATPQAPHAVSIGISRVWVNGRLVFADGATTGNRPGRVIRRWDR